jgi:hypothetical protein
VKRAASFAVLVVYALIIFGCGNSSSNGMPSNPASAQVRVVQGVLDAGDLDALINGTKAPAASSPLATPPYFAVSGTSVTWKKFLRERRDLPSSTQCIRSLPTPSPA